MTPTDPGSAPRPERNRPVPLAELADVLGDPLGGGQGAAPEITGVTLASDDVRPGDLYAALPGARTHGARFAADAATRGAVAVLTDRDGLLDAAATGLPVCVVDDPRAVLGTVADRIYGEPSSRLAVIGITGTNGKTTTAYLVEAGLAAAGMGTGPDRHRADPHPRPRRRRHADGDRGPERAHHPRGAGAARAARRDGRVRGLRRGHGGLQPRARARPGRRHPVRGRRVHQPGPRPPRLPRRPRGVLPRQGAAVRRPVGPSS